MNSQAQQVYIKTQANTAHPGELTLMLYNGCLKFMKQGMESIERREFEAKNNNLQRAIDILDELQITLNMDYEISSNLFSLYAFIKERVVEANIRMNKDSIQVCINLLIELRDTWVQALKQVKSGVQVNS
jgi:flagellar secretion chaperone FliS